MVLARSSVGFLRLRENSLDLVEPREYDNVKRHWLRRKLNFRHNEPELSRKMVRDRFWHYLLRWFAVLDGERLIDIVPQLK